MSKNRARPKYDASRSREDYTLHPARRFQLEWEADPGTCYLFALDERQASMLRKMVQVFPKYYWVWGIDGPQANWDGPAWALWEEINDFVSETEACLVSGCDIERIVKPIRLLTAAILGESLDLTDEDALLPESVDYTGQGQYAGLVPTIEQLKLDFSADFDEIGAEIASLELSPTITVDCDCGGAGCGCCTGGTEPPSDPGDQGGDAPDGWSDPTDLETDEPVTPGSTGYNDRKCAVANLIHNRTVAQVQAMKLAGIDDWAAFLAGGLAGAGATYISALLSAAATPFTIPLAVIGVLWGIILVLLENVLDLDNLLILMSQNEDDLVCSLYNSSEPITARDNYIEVLDNAGASAGNLLFIQAILLVDTLNALYFNPDDYLAALKAAMVGYVGPVDCADCGCEHQITGNLISDDGSTLTVEATAWGGGYRFQVLFLDRCNPVTWTGYSVISGSLTPHPGTVDDWRVYSFENPSTPGSDGDIYSSDTPPSGFPYSNVSELAISSGDAYTIEIYYSEEV